MTMKPVTTTVQRQVPQYTTEYRTIDEPVTQMVPEQTFETVTQMVPRMIPQEVVTQVPEQYTEMVATQVPRTQMREVIETVQPRMETVVTGYETVNTQERLVPGPAPMTTM